MPSPGDLTCVCPRCRTELWAQRKGQWTLANRILKMGDDGVMLARCPECASDVPVPFLIIAPQNAEPTPTPRPSVPGVTGVRMVVRVDKHKSP
mgnify:CR=1 FL=1